MDFIKDPMFWVLIGLIVLLAIMMIFRFRQQKKAQAEQVSLLDSLKVGDHVTTHIGVYGRIVKIEETTQGKVFTIETGDKNKCELQLDYRYIAGIDNKELVTYDANGNVIEKNSEPVAKQETPEIEKEINAETTIDGEVVKEEKKTKKQKNENK